MVEVTTEYASHFYDMYINKHQGKHLTGDRMKILMLNLPSVLWDLINQEVRAFAFVRLKIWYNIGPTSVRYWFNIGQISSVMS
jgi:hypothetical protein